MKPDYFHDCTTLDQVKVRYKQLALKLHPDKAGDQSTEEMKDLNLARDNKIKSVLISEGKDPAMLQSILLDFLEGKQINMKEIANNVDKEMTEMGIGQNSWKEVWDFVAAKVFGTAIPQPKEKNLEEKQKLIDQVKDPTKKTNG